MKNNRKIVKTGKYVALALNINTGELEIWQVYREQYELWDSGMRNKDEALEIWRYAEKHYTDGLL